MKQKEHTLKDVLSAINVFNEDTDITVDGIGTIAVCPPVTITKEGLDHWHDALQSKMYNGDPFTTNNDSEELDKRVWKFLIALAGYCPETKYQQWFQDYNTEEL